MSAVDVGDALELTFTTAPGATVTVSWFDPAGAAVLDAVGVPEVPVASGLFPMTFVPTSPGVWSALFTAAGTATAVERYWVRASATTGPAPLATVGEVATQFGVLTTAQEGLTAALLRAASRIVRARFPPVDAWIADGLLDPEVVALVVVNMVLRVLRNPNGLRAETIGPFSRTYDTTTAAGLLALSAEDLLLLVPVTVARRVRVGTIIVGAGLAPYPHGLTRAQRGW